MSQKSGEILSNIPTSKKEASFLRIIKVHILMSAIGGNQKNKQKSNITITVCKNYPNTDREDTK